FKHALKHNKEELTLVELGSHLRIEESLRVHDSDKAKNNNVVGPSVVNMVEHNNSTRYNDNKGKCKHQDTKTDPNKKSKDDDVAWWVHSGETVHVCKDRCWFKTYKSLNDGSILHMRNESTALVHGCGCIDLRFSSGKIISLFNVLHVLNIRKNMVSSSILNNRGYKKVIESDKFILSKHGHVHSKRMQDMSKDGLIPAFDMNTESGSCQTPDPKLKTLGERDIECIFVGYAEHSKAFRFYVIEPNESVLVNSIIELRDAIFDENRFSLIPRLSQRSLINRTEYIGGLVVPEEITKEVVVQQHEPDLRKSKRNRTPKNFGPEFQLYLIEGARDEVSDQHSYCFNVEDDPKIFDKMDVKTAFLNGELDEKVYMNGFIMPGNEDKVDLTWEFLSSRFSMKDKGDAD
ncbi:hypothetical protein Tco_1187533, partial [Tanacetum coccineum]